MIVTCNYCRCELETESAATIFRRVLGWEKKAHGLSRRGGSDIVLREPVDEFACRPCIDALKSGRSPHQEALLPRERD